MNSVSETVSPAGLKAAETATPEGTLDRPNVSRTARSTASSLASPERTNVSAEMSHVSIFGHPPPYERPAPPVTQDGTDRLFTQREGV